MANRKIKTGTMFRGFELDRSSVDEEARTVELSFSSEAPVERWFGTEILDHKKKSVRLQRLNSGGALVMDHDPGDQVGVVEKATIGSDRMGRALVRFGKSGRAEEVFQDVVDGIRRNVSVGYRIHRMVLEEENDDQSTYRAVDWEPLEISLVAVPADTNVGVGRAGEDGFFETEIEIEEERKMSDKAEDKKVQTAEPVQQRQAPVDTGEIEERARERASKAEQNRVREILAYGKQFRCEDDAMAAVQDGRSVEDFRKMILERMKDKLTPVQAGSDEIGLTRKEAEHFSFLRAINAMANPADRRAQEAAKFEFEVSAAFAEKTRREPQGIFVPPEVLRRDLTVGTDNAGGYTVATDLLAQDFIELLRNRMMVRRAGATILTGLVGDVAIPSMTAGATAYWVAESGAPTESQQTFGQLALAPKTVGAFTDLSRKLLLQSSVDIEMMVRTDLATVLAIAIDLAALHGSGSSNQPTGIASTTGIGSVEGGTNGLAPAWSHIIDLETEVAQDNADLGALGYMTNAKVRGKLRQVFTNATYGEIPIYTNGPEPGVGEVNGYPCYVTNQVSSTLDKGTSTGVCSAIFFGNWRDLVIGFWSGVDLLVDPYTGSSSGTVRVVALQDCDVGVRHAVSFAAMLDALTS